MNAIAEIPIEQLESLPAATMLRLVERSKKIKKNLTAFQACITALPTLFLRLEELDIEPGMDPTTDYISISFTGDGAKLGQVWGELRRHGYSTSGRPEKGKNEYYSFWYREGFCTLWLHFTSSVCRRVKVGTETKIVDVYETHCGEMPELGEPQPALTVIDGGAEDMPF